MLSNRVMIDNVEINPNSPTTEMEQYVVEQIQEGFGHVILSLQCPVHNRAVAIHVRNLGHGKRKYVPSWCCNEFRATAEAEWLKQNTAS